MQSRSEIDFGQLAARIKAWGGELGFDKLGIAGTELGEDEAHLLNWLHEGRHGVMDYMRRHGSRRARPQDLQAGTVRVISARMNYFPEGARDAWEVLRDAESGYVARYALGRDYHKLVRARLQKLANRIEDEIGPFGFRAGAGEGAGAQFRTGLDRQAHAVAGPRCGLLVLPRRAVHRSAAAGRRTFHRALRHLHALHRHLPHTRDHRPETARRTPLHRLSHHRIEGRDPDRVAATDRQSCLRLRRLPTDLPVEQVRTADA